jgi:hypothetical protein
MSKTWKPSDFIRHGWCQGWHAKDENGEHCDAHYGMAIQWDILGAIGRSRRTGFNPGDDAISRLGDALGSIATRHGRSFLQAWNDHPERTQAEVISVLEGVGL